MGSSFFLIVRDCSTCRGSNSSHCVRVFVISRICLDFANNSTRSMATRMLINVYEGDHIDPRNPR